MRSKPLFAAALTALATALSAPAFAQGVIKIGEVNSYKAQPAFLEPYKKGMELAVDEVNAAGGIGGRKIELVIRDDNANPGDAVRAAEELVSREQVDVLAGTFLSHIGLALTDFAKQKKILNMVLAQGRVTLSEVALELDTPMDQVEDMVRDLVGKNLFSGAINWEDGVLYSKQASQMKADRKCPNCGGEVTLAGKGVIECPFCGSEVFLAS